MLKFWLAVCLIALAYWTIMTLSWPIKVAAVILLGLLYAHLIELQHEALHEHAFRSRRLNRLYGVACGVFMLSSYSAYKYEHLRHHAALGKPQNREFFNYRFDALNSPGGFVKAAFHLGRYIDVLHNIGRSLLGLPLPGIQHSHDMQKMHAEYRVFAVILVGAIVVTVMTSTPFALVAWVLPALFIAEPVHFLIELPEHFGLNTQSDRNVLSNTRTIKASRLVQWYTNYNNLHTAHHFHQGVPMAQAAVLGRLITDRCEAVEESYWDFYRKVLRGEIRYRDLSETCMTR